MEKCVVTYRMRVILWKNTPVVAAALSSLDVVADAAGPSGVHPVFPAMMVELGFTVTLVHYASRSIGAACVAVAFATNARILHRASTYVRGLVGSR